MAINNWMISCIFSDFVVLNVYALIKDNYMIFACGVQKLINMFFNDGEIQWHMCLHSIDMFMHCISYVLSLGIGSMV